MSETKKPVKPVSETAATEPPAPMDGELGEDDLDLVSGGLRPTGGPIIKTDPDVCITKLA